MKTLPALASFAFALIGAICNGQDEPSPFLKTIEWSEKEVAPAREKLAAERASIAAEQKPIITELMQLQSHVNALRKERSQLASNTSSLQAQIDTLSKAVQNMKSSRERAAHRFLSIRSKFEENLHLAERDSYRDKLLAPEKIRGESTAERLERFKLQIEIGKIALERTNAQIGGHAYDGETLIDSVQSPGRVLQIGPYVFFAPQDGVAGFLIENENLTTTLRTHSLETSKAIQAVFDGNSNTLPFDPTLDQAFLAADSQTSLWEHVKSGGIWMIPITLFGILSTVFGLVKIFQIREINIPNQDQIATLIAIENAEAFENQIAPFDKRVRPIFSEGFAYRNESQEKRTSAMQQVFLTFRHQLESHLSLIALTAAVAPLLGLLGTVTGMIKTFQIISIHGAGDARVLSGGISEALVTTEFGLVVAIPALLAHAWLSRRTRRIAIQTSALADRYNKSLTPSDSDA